MKTVEAKTTSTLLQPKPQRSGTPFFQKEGGGGVFSTDQHDASIIPINSFRRSSLQVSRPFFSPSTIQAKSSNHTGGLTIGQPNDKYEKEADAKADEVVQRLEDPNHNPPSIQTKCDHCLPAEAKATDGEEEQLQKKEELEESEKDIQEKPIIESEAASKIQKKEDTSAEVEEKEESLPELQEKRGLENNTEHPVSDIQAKTESPPSTTPITETIATTTYNNSTESPIQKEEIEKEDQIPEGDIEVQRKPVFESGGEGEDDESVMAKSNDGQLTASTGLQDKLNSSKGSGRPISEDTRSSMEDSFGADFSNVNIHTGSDAIDMSKDLGAQAFTHGSDIYFNEGKYDTDSSSGKHLLAHELTHTVQQGGAKVKRSNRISDSPSNIQKKSWYNFDIPFTDYYFDPSPGGIANATGIAAGNLKYTLPLYWQYRAFNWGKDLAFGELEKVALQTLKRLAADEYVELMNKESFQPNTIIQAYLYAFASSGDEAPVNVRFGNMAKGQIFVSADIYRQEFLADSQGISMTHPGLDVDTKKDSMGLQIKIIENKVTGQIGIVRDVPQKQFNSLIPVAKGLADSFLQNDMFYGIIGEDYDRGELTSITYNNFLKNGVLAVDFSAILGIGGKQLIRMGFAIINDAYDWVGLMDVKVNGIEEKEMEIDRDDEGQLFGNVPSLNLHEVWKSERGFLEVTLDASFEKGILDIRGNATFQTDRLSGSLSLLVTDEKIAKEKAKQNTPIEIPEDNGASDSKDSATTFSKIGTLGITGWGVLHIVVVKDKDDNELIHGEAAFVVDPDGYVTVNGRLTVKPVIQLTKQYPETPEWTPRFKELEWSNYLPIMELGWLMAEVKGGLYTKYIIHPLQLHDIEIEGTYSTNKAITNTLQIGASLNGFAEALGKIEISGLVALRAGFPIPYLGVNVAAINFKFSGEASLGGGFDISPKIVMSGQEGESSGKAANAFPDFTIKGKVVVGGVLDVGIKGELILELVTADVEKIDINLNRHIGSFGIHTEFEHQFGKEFNPIVSIDQGKYKRRQSTMNILRLYDKGKASGERTGGYYEDGKEIGGIEDDKKIINDQHALPKTEITDDFSMEGNDHHLIIIVGAPGIEAELKMASHPEILIHKIEIAKTNLIKKKAEYILDDEKSNEIERRVKNLNKIKKAAGKVLDNATKLGIDPTKGKKTTIPGFKELGDMIQEYGDKYGVTDLKGEFQPDEEPPGTRRNPFEIIWPKPPSINYPPIYLGGEIDGIKSQSKLKELHTKGFKDETGTKVTKYFPHKGGTLDGGQKIGISETFRIYKNRIIGPLSTDTTPGGDKLNRILKKYGYLPGRDGDGMDADHVHEIQYGGKDLVENLWPLDSDINQDSGRTLKDAIVYYPKSGKTVKIKDLKLNIKNYYFKIIKFEY